MSGNTFAQPRITGAGVSLTADKLGLYSSLKRLDRTEDGLAREKMPNPTGRPHENSIERRLTIHPTHHYRATHSVQITVCGGGIKNDSHKAIISNLAVATRRKHPWIREKQPISSIVRVSVLKWVANDKYTLRMPDRAGT